MSTISGIYVPPQKTIITKQEAVAAMWDGLNKLKLSPTVNLCSVLMAHSALESGNFAHGWNYNYPNIKHENTRDGKYTCIVLNEILIRGGKRTEIWFSPEGELTAAPSKGGKLIKQFQEKPCAIPPGHPQTRMRAYDNPGDGIADKLKFLTKPKWKPCIDLARTGNAAGYVRAIHARNYFTADPKPYERAVVSLNKTYRPLVEAYAKTLDQNKLPELPKLDDETTNDIKLVTRFDWDLDKALERAGLDIANQLWAHFQNPNK